MEIAMLVLAVLGLGLAGVQTYYARKQVRQAKEDVAAAEKAKLEASQPPALLSAPSIHVPTAAEIDRYAVKRQQGVIIEEVRKRHIALDDATILSVTSRIMLGILMLRFIVSEAADLIALIRRLF